MNRLHTDAITLAVFLLASGYGVYLRWRQGRRRRDIVAWAKRHGYQFTGDSYGLTDTWPGDPFDRGHNKRSLNVVRGTIDDRPFVTFDHTYRRTAAVTSHPLYGRLFTRHDRVVTLTVAAMSTGMEWTPRLDLAPENAVSRTIARLANRDLNLESEDFNRAFTVTCTDPRFASDVLHPRLMEAVLSMSPRPRVQIRNGYIFTINDAVLPTADLRAQLLCLARVLNLLPPFVVSDYSTTPSANPTVHPAHRPAPTSFTAAPAAPSDGPPIPHLPHGRIPPVPARLPADPPEEH